MIDNLIQGAAMIVALIVLVGIVDTAFTIYRRMK